MRREHEGDGEVVVERAARLGPSASRLRRASHRARGWVRCRFKGWAPWLGYLYLALALAYAIDGAVVLGIVGLALGVPVTWTCGLWVVPRSEDAYVLAVSNTLRDSGVEIEQAQRRHSAKSAELATAVLDSLPASLQPELRQRLNDALHRKATSAVLTQDALFTRLVSAHKQRVALRAMLVRIEIKDDDVSEVTATMRTFLDERNAADRMYLDAVRQEQTRLTQIVPPTTLRGFHDMLLQLYDRYIDAVAAYYLALEYEQIDEIQQTAKRMCDLWQARQDYSRTMANRLRESFGGSH